MITGFVRRQKALLVFASGFLCVLAFVAGAQAQSAKTPLKIPIVYLTKAEAQKIPLSLVEPILTDEGVQGARQGIGDNQTTGRFLKHEYALIEVVVPKDGDLTAVFKEARADGHRLFVADLRGEQLLALARMNEAADALLFNVRAPDDALRNESCRSNLFHVIPSRAMKADALAQYLVSRKWRDWFLVLGTRDRDRLFADALRRAAKKFNAKIVEERVFEGEAPSARTDSGHAQIQKQMPVFTQGADDHDVLVVADESDIFGEYLPYRTWDPRPVVGTQGMVPTGWHRSHEQWGGTQMQRRFKRLAGRDMTERDFTSWAAVRSIGEAVTRTGSADIEDIRAYLLGDKFKLAAFKGQGLTFRPWSQQMRQPILLAAPRSLVSVSPQAGFLHHRSTLDTLGYDKPESRCKLQ